MLKDNILNPFFNYIFSNEIIANLCTTLFVTYFAYLIIKTTIGGIKRWYRLFMIS